MLLEISGPGQVQSTAVWAERAAQVAVQTRGLGRATATRPWALSLHSPAGLQAGCPGMHGGGFCPFRCPACSHGDLKRLRAGPGSPLPCRAWPLVRGLPCAPLRGCGELGAPPGAFLVRTLRDRTRLWPGLGAGGVTGRGPRVGRGGRGSAGGTTVPFSTDRPASPASALRPPQREKSLSLEHGLDRRCACG